MVHGDRPRLFGGYWIHREGAPSTKCRGWVGDGRNVQRVVIVSINRRSPSRRCTTCPPCFAIIMDKFDCMPHPISHIPRHRLVAFIPSHAEPLFLSSTCKNWRQSVLFTHNKTLFWHKLIFFYSSSFCSTVFIQSINQVFNVQLLTLFVVYSFSSLFFSFLSKFTQCIHTTPYLSVFATHSLYTFFKHCA